MKELIKKVLYESIGNLSEGYGSPNTLPLFIRQQLQKVYEPLGMWGRAPNPTDDCITNVGVINIFPHSNEDVWSVLNRFDTNTKVKNKLYELFNQTKPIDTSDNTFREWINTNSDDLFGPNGTHTEELVSLNMTTIISGNNNEMMAVDILKEKFPKNAIKRFCSGDIRDTQKGIDIVIEYPNKDITVQVKPFRDARSWTDPDGETFFEISSYTDVNKYSEKNVNIFMFVKYEKNEFILFKNQKSKIRSETYKGFSMTRFYEPTLYTNIEFQTKGKNKSKNLDSTDSLFDVDRDMLKNLYFRKHEIEKMIEKIEKKLVP